MDSSTPINRTSPFIILGVNDLFFISFVEVDVDFMQTLQTLIRLHILLASVLSQHYLLTPLLA